MVAGLRAIQEVLDRPRGKPVTPLAHSGSLDDRFSQMTDEELIPYFVKFVLSSDKLRSAMAQALKESPSNERR